MEKQRADYYIKNGEFAAAFLEDLAKSPELVFLEAVGITRNRVFNHGVAVNSLVRALINAQEENEALRRENAENKKLLREFEKKEIEPIISERIKQAKAALCEWIAEAIEEF